MLLQAKIKSNKVKDVSNEGLNTQISTAMNKLVDQLANIDQVFYIALICFSFGLV